MDPHDPIHTGTPHIDDPWDPWHDPLAEGPWGPEVGARSAPAESVPSPASGEHARRTDPAAVYLQVQRSAAFQEVRRGHRRFVLTAVALFLTWYLIFLVAAAAAPDLMSHQVFGAIDVALLAGLAQIAATSLFAWAYARHARLRRDRTALDLRWHTQERIR